MCPVTLETTHLDLDPDAALVVVDVQRGFDDPSWGTRGDDGSAEANVAALVDAWRRSGRPVVLVRHDSVHPTPPLHPDADGNRLKPEVTDAMAGAEPDLLVTKTVNSAFHGSPDLAAWLRGRGSRQVLVCGVQTNFCCETTARVGANLGFDVVYVLDATWTYDLPGFSGGTVPASLLREVTATNLANEFCRVAATATVVAAAG
jgi:nicotinamidase-related amidase